MTTNTGGPAFPCTEENYRDPRWTSEGLSLRDYFAAKALGVMCSSNVNSTGTFASQDGREAVASICYLMADAMLRARG
jgi:hypothetical protein